MLIYLRKKKILYSLTAVYGIGLHTAKKILEKAKVDSEIRTFELDDDSVGNIRSVLEDNYTVEGDLRKLKSLNINRLVSINCFRGKRHRQGLPLRGQRTRTNARTRRGSKKTMAGKKK